jgi:hypothetical protein
MRSSVKDNHDPIPLVREKEDSGFSGFHSYAWTSGGKIHIGPSFFNKSPREQAAALFHELTHLYADTVDYFYLEAEIQRAVPQSTTG